MPSACIIRKHYIAKRCPYIAGVTRFGVTIYHRPYKRKKPLHWGQRSASFSVRTPGNAIPGAELWGGSAQTPSGGAGRVKFKGYNLRQQPANRANCHPS